MIRRLVLIALAASVCVGCDSKPKTYPVAGKVSLDGKPLTDASILLSLESGESIAMGDVKDGSFSFDCPAGTYKVQFKAARPIPGSGVPEMGNVPMMQESLPAKYNTQTALKAEVQPSTENSLKFDLASK